MKAFYALWLNEIEHGIATWEKDEEKIKFRGVFVLHPATSVQSAPPSPVASSTRKQHKLDFAYNTSVRPGTRANKAFNKGTCTIAAAHPSQLQKLRKWDKGKSQRVNHLSCNRIGG